MLKLVGFGCALTEFKIEASLKFDVTMDDAIPSFRKEFEDDIRSYLSYYSDSHKCLVSLNKLIIRHNSNFVSNNTIDTTIILWLSITNENYVIDLNNELSMEIRSMCSGEGKWSDRFKRLEDGCGS